MAQHIHKLDSRGWKHKTAKQGILKATIVVLEDLATDHTAIPYYSSFANSLKVFSSGKSRNGIDNQKPVRRGDNRSNSLDASR